MAITNGYTTLAVVREALNIASTADTSKDARIEQAIEAASRMIDNYTGRRFYSTAEDETKYYKADAPCVAYINDDIVSVTTLATDDYGDRTYPTEWETTDYDLMPANGTPYTWIEVTPNGNYSFPSCNKGVKIIGKFGYCASDAQPDPITEACILQACRLFKRVSEAPFGVSGASDMGQAVAIAKFDPDVKMLVDPYRRVF